MAFGESHTTNNGKVPACELHIQVVDFLPTCQGRGPAISAPAGGVSRNKSRGMGLLDLWVMGDGTPEKKNAENNADGSRNDHVEVLKNPWGVMSAPIQMQGWDEAIENQ